MQQVDTKSLIGEEAVKVAIKEDLGPSVELLSWDVKDFTSKGDNYACKVTSIECKISRKGKEQNISYVVKLNPQVSFIPPILMNAIFIKEGEFFRKIGPNLNATLESANLPKINFPKCFYACYENGKEILIVEDLRKRGFKMTDRKKGMNMMHTKLVIKELAKFHAISMVKQLKDPNFSFEKEYEFLKTDMTQFPELLTQMFEGQIKNSVVMLKKIGGYEGVIKWLEGKTDVISQFFATFVPPELPFRTLVHGDTWSNNLLFRYNERNHPVEVMLIDLQATRVGSPMVDINYLLYTSLNGNVRRFNIDGFLDSYHDIFSNVCSKFKVTTPFNLKQLHEEFYDKNMVGLFAGMFIIPMVVLESEDAPDFSASSPEEIEKLIQQTKERNLEQLDSNPLLEPRFLSLINEMISNGAIKTK